LRVRVASKTTQNLVAKQSQCGTYFSNIKKGKAKAVPLQA